MSSNHIFSRYFSSARQMACFSILIGLLGALLFGGLSSLLLHNKREADYDILSRDISQFLSTFFHELQVSAEELQPLTLQDCQQVAKELTSRAAFNINVRTFLLVRSGIAYCSSATGTMNMPMRDLVHQLNLNKEVDLAIMAGTPMMPGKPTLAAWFRHPRDNTRGIFTTLNVNLTPYLLFTARQRDVTSMALVAGENALSTASATIVKRQQLPPDATRISSIDGYPIQLYLYGSPWPVQDIQLSILAGLAFGLVSGCICAFVLMIKLRPGKEILTGIKNGQFFVVYQPVLDAGELKLRGVEALMRWDHPDAGMISPDAFIGFAEAQQLIVPLTCHLFELVAKDAAALQTILPPGAKLGINLAPSHLHSPTFKDDIKTFATALPPHHFQVVFEITERGMLKEQEAMSVFSWLHEQGFEIAIDDFGTGHSALIYLERFTLDYLKIDRGFVNSIGLETVTAPVLDAVLTLARRLNMHTIAEGVETREQAKWLIERGVNYLQGYYFSRPLSLHQLLNWKHIHKEKA